MLETFSDATEIQQALLAIRSITDLPVVAQMTIQTDGNTSYGLLQIRYLYHPRVGNGCKACAGSSWPNSQHSTAYAVDQQVAELRGCYDGMSTYLGGTRGHLWGCIGSWYSGAWDPSGGNYAANVRRYYEDKPWLGWSG